MKDLLHSIVHVGMVVNFDLHIFGKNVEGVGSLNVAIVRGEMNWNHVSPCPHQPSLLAPIRFIDLVLLFVL